MCPYYVIKIESKSKLVPQLKRCFVEGALYRDLAILLPVATKTPNPVAAIGYALQTTRSTRRSMFLNNREILLNARGTKVFLNRENIVEYRIEEFLKITKKNDEVRYIIALSTKDSEQQGRITKHNTQTPIPIIPDMNVDFLYISMKNRLTIKISPHDRVFITTFSEMATAGIGTVRCILHPQYNEFFDLHNDFTKLIYLVELDSAENTKKVVERNMTRMANKSLLCANEPIQYLRCEVYDICRCSDS
jgi:hypothetical protein